MLQPAPRYQDANRGSTRMPEPTRLKRGPQPKNGRGGKVSPGGGDPGGDPLLTNLQAVEQSPRFHLQFGEQHAQPRDDRIVAVEARQQAWQQPEKLPAHERSAAALGNAHAAELRALDRRDLHAIEVNLSTDRIARAGIDRDWSLPAAIKELLAERRRTPKGSGEGWAPSGIASN